MSTYAYIIHIYACALVHTCLLDCIHSPHMLLYGHVLLTPTLTDVNSFKGSALSLRLPATASMASKPPLFALGFDLYVNILIRVHLYIHTYAHTCLHIRHGSLLLNAALSMCNSLRRARKRTGISRNGPVNNSICV